jgi:hypothetical protein
MVDEVAVTLFVVALSDYCRAAIVAIGFFIGTCDAAFFGEVIGGVVVAVLLRRALCRGLSRMRDAQRLLWRYFDDGVDGVDLIVGCTFPALAAHALTVDAGWTISLEPLNVSL